MAQADVELVKRMFESYGGGNLDETLEFFSEDIEWDTAELPGVGVVRGRAELRALSDQLLESFDDFRMDAGELEDLGERVLAEVHQSGRGRGSGVEVELHYWFVVTTRKGLISRVDAFLDETEARAAAAPERP